MISALDSGSGVQGIYNSTKTPLFYHLFHVSYESNIYDLVLPFFFISQ